MKLSERIKRTLALRPATHCMWFKVYGFGFGVSRVGLVEDEGWFGAEFLHFNIYLGIALVRIYVPIELGTDVLE